MKITILYDNYQARDDLYYGWGFSCLVEYNNETLLFDTGENGNLLLKNMEKLNIDPGKIDHLFISHDHWDHTGGIGDILKISEPAVYVSSSFELSEYSGEVKYIDSPVEIFPGAFSSGALMDFEQSLFLETDTGSVCIVGCAHPGIKNIIDSCPCPPVKALIGGFHDFRDFAALEGIGLICPTHCTVFRDKIFSLYAEKCLECGAGSVIQID